MPQTTGFYEGEVVQHRLEKNQKGTWLLNVEVEYQDPQEGIIKVWIPIYITAKAKGMATAALLSLGFDLKVHKTTKVLQHDQQMLAGNKADIRVFEDEYQGNVKVKTEFLFGNKSMTDSECDELDAVLGSAEEPKSEKPKAPRAPRRVTTTDIEKEMADHKADVKQNAGNKDPF